MSSYYYSPNHQPNNSRNGNATSIKEAIYALLDSYRLRHKFNETIILNAWDDILGKEAAQKTKKLYIQQQVLYAEVASAALRHDLLMMKSRLIELLNEQADAEVITDIVLL
ncbi:MAG: DUF721 domain-containing protein [Cytophagales bacterium]|nr:MAG: DUF721 domain-containing protein [Cytophagales bacterium]